MSPTVGSEMLSNSNEDPLVEELPDLEPRKHRRAGFHRKYGPRPLSPEMLNTNNNAGRESLSQINRKLSKFFVHFYLPSFLGRIIPKDL